jgi:hypothetical protein
MKRRKLITRYPSKRVPRVRSAPASEIMARADEARRRRRLGVAAGAGGLAAAAVTVSMALPASHPVASHPAASHPTGGHPANGTGARLAAWTVTREADGAIQISFFRQLRDPAALQATLRADGVPASVTFIGQQNPACHSIPNPGVRPPSPGESGSPQLPNNGPGSGNGTWLAANGPGDALAIRPSALPSGDGVQIAVMRGILAGPSGP